MKKFRAALVATTVGVGLTLSVAAPSANATAVQAPQSLASAPAVTSGVCTLFTPCGWARNTGKVGVGFAEEGNENNYHWILKSGSNTLNRTLDAGHLFIGEGYLAKIVDTETGYVSWVNTMGGPRRWYFYDRDVWVNAKECINVCLEW